MTTSFHDQRRAWLTSMWHDGRFAVRSLAARPWRFMAAVSMLGLAIGITTAMFTIVDALILPPVPFKDPDQLATVIMGDKRGGTSPTSDVFRVWSWAIVVSVLSLTIAAASWHPARSAVRTAPVVLLREE